MVLDRELEDIKDLVVTEEIPQSLSQMSITALKLVSNVTGNILTQESEKMVV